MFFPNDDDDAEFTPSAGSKLASLFGMDKVAGDGSNQSLKYHPPKEPKKDVSSANSSSGSQLAVLHAVPVHAFKMNDGKYVSQGKLGMAIIGQHATREYKLLLYVTKTQQVTHAVITQDFRFMIQPDNYVIFYDHINQLWSVKFETEAQLTQFSKQLALAKANYVGASLDTVITQDLVCGSGSGLETGDSVELMYTGWLLTDCGFGIMFESNANADKLLRFKIGKGKVVKGLDIGVVGLKKDGVRLVIVPPQLGYGTESKGKIPASATLIYEIKAVRVKVSRDRDDGEAAMSTPTDNDPQNIAEETKSDDSLQTTQTTTKPDKAKLISRIAKMGQAMFPVAEPTVSSSSPASPSPSQTDTEQEPRAGDVASDEKHSANTKPPLPTKPVSSPAYHAAPTQLSSSGQQQNYNSIQHEGFGMLHPSSHLALYQPSLQALPQNYTQLPFGGIPQHAFIQSTSAVPPVTMATDSTVPLLLSETRTQTTEMRMSLSKVADKVDRIYDKLDQLHQIQSQQQAAAVSTVAITTSLDTSVLLNSIQRIVEENERLKKEVMEKSTKIELQNEKISDLLNRSQKFLEQSNTMFEQRSDTLKASAEQNQARLLALEQDKMQLMRELNSRTSELSDLQVELNSRKLHESNLEIQLKAALDEVKDQQQVVNTMKVKQTETEKERDHLLEQQKADRTVKEELQSELNRLKDEMAELKKTKDKIQQSQHEKEQKLAHSESELEEKLKEAKQKYEKEISQLKEKLQSASSSEHKEQVEKLNKEWQTKCDTLLKDAEVRHQKSVAEIQKRNEHLEELVKVTEEKYESLRSQAAMMKQRYEKRIIELEPQQRAAQMSETAKEKIIAKVKQVMNTVYHELKGHFESDQTYRGDEINGNIMNTIKRVTMKMMHEDEADEEGPVEITVAQTSAVTSAIPNMDRGQHDTGATKTTVQTPGGDKQLSRDNKECIEEPIIESSVCQTTATIPSGSHDNKGEGHKEISPDIITPTIAFITGGHGNPYYHEELERNAEEKKVAECSSAKQIVTEVIKAAVAPSTGDKGNPYYGEELTESAVSECSSARPGIVLEAIQAAMAPSTGDRGNPYYAEELNKSSVHNEESMSEQHRGAEVLGEVIKSVVAPSTGDKGNPYYAAELDDAGKKVDRIEEKPTPAQSGKSMETDKSATEEKDKKSAVSAEQEKDTKSGTSEWQGKDNKGATTPAGHKKDNKDAASTDQEKDRKNAASKDQEKDKKGATSAGQEKDSKGAASGEQEKDKKSDTSGGQEKDKKSATSTDQKNDNKGAASAGQEKDKKSTTSTDQEKDKKSATSGGQEKDKKSTTSGGQEKDNKGAASGGQEKHKKSDTLQLGNKKTVSEKKKTDDFDDDLKPKPPPLFDDDDEDDDMNWLK